MQSLLLASLIVAGSGNSVPPGSTFLPPTSALAVQLDNLLPLTDSGFQLGGYISVKQGALIQPGLDAVELISCKTKTIMTRAANAEFFQGCTVTAVEEIPEGALTFTFSDFLQLLAGPTGA